MKITRVETIATRGPRRKAFGQVSRTALGPAEFSLHGLVFIETDAGLTGIGEMASCFTRRGPLLCRETDALLTPVLLGQDPRRITALTERVDAALFGAEPAKAGVEMALWDILGKSLGQPIHALLGGKVRERVPLSYSIPFGTPEQMARFAAETARAGFRTVKVKLGQGRAEDIEAVGRVRDAIGPGHRLRVDANMAWRTPKEAIAIIAAIEPFGVELVEQPLPPRELDGLAEIRRSVRVPIMVDESVWGPRDAAEVIRRGAADVVNVYVAEAGGIHKARRIFELCESFGVPCIIGSMPEHGIGTAAQIHLGVAMTNLGYDSDTCGVLYHEEDLLRTPLRIEGGFAYAPDGPGLGVEVDMDVVERWRERG